MNILISTNSKFVHPAEVMLYSLCKSNINYSIDIYLAECNLPESDIEKLRAVVSLFEDKSLHVISIPSEKLENLMATEQYSTEIYYRIFALEYLPEDVDRIIYFDVDTIIKKELFEIYNYEFDEMCPFVVCEDAWIKKRGGYEGTIERCGITSGYTYFNSGFMLINMKYIRLHRSVGYIVDAFRRESEVYPYPDQDVLNHMYYDKVEYVPSTLFNCIPDEWWLDGKELAKNKIRYITYGELNDWSIDRSRFVDVTQNIRDNAVVIHFMAFMKPWLYRDGGMYGDLAPYADIWFEYERELENRMRL